MTNLKKYIGTYQYENKVLTNTTGLKLMIANRSNTTNTKTPLFLLDKTTIKGGYISSLYPLANDLFKFDYKGFAYHLKVDNLEKVAFISHVLIS